MLLKFEIHLSDLSIAFANLLLFFCCCYMYDVVCWKCVAINVKVIAVLRRFTPFYVVSKVHRLNFILIRLLNRRIHALSYFVCCITGCYANIFMFKSIPQHKVSGLIADRVTNWIQYMKCLNLRFHSFIHSLNPIFFTIWTHPYGISIFVFDGYISQSHISIASKAFLIYSIRWNLFADKIDLVMCQHWLDSRFD